VKPRRAISSHVRSAHLGKSSGKLIARLSTSDDETHPAASSEPGACVRALGNHTSDAP
jgi:hypothetical protein